MALSDANKALLAALGSPSWGLTSPEDSDAEAAMCYDLAMRLYPEALRRTAPDPRSRRGEESEIAPAAAARLTAAQVQAFLTAYRAGQFDPPA